MSGMKDRVASLILNERGELDPLTLTVKHLFDVLEKGIQKESQAELTWFNNMVSLMNKMGTWVHL